ncbi:MAG: adenylate kinase [Oligoflexia bacterium]|nr:adenylate kinase [Oligoflexia bacterium]
MSSVILLGAPGSGKGTIATRLKSEWEVAHISTGDMFREAIANKTAVGQKAEGYIKSGSLVPDEVTIEVVRERFSKPDVKNGFILDGFPRTIKQAEALNNILAEQSLELDGVVLLNVPSSLIVDRITGRRSCTKCGTIYHLKNMPPKQDGICDKCGSGLMHRKDDTEEVVKDRLSAYNDLTAPLIEFYRNMDLLLEIDASTNPDDMIRQVRELDL